MGDESVNRGMKRLSEQSAAEISGFDRVRSKRWTALFDQRIVGTSSQPKNVDAYEHSENEVRGDDENTVAGVNAFDDAGITRNSTMRRMKRLLQQCAPENCEIGAHNYEIGGTVDQGRAESNSILRMRTLSDQPAIHQRRSQFNHLRSKRWRKMFDSHIDEGSSQCQNVDGAEYSDNQFRSDNLQNIVIEEAEVASNSMTRRMTRLRHGCAENYGIGKAVEQGRIKSNRECSQPFGQASYQRSRQGLVITYEDSGDNIYTCDYCNARFWSGEAIKKSSANAPLIYTNCCKKGQIKIEQAKPTPIFLEKLLNPDNGPESKLFRENIRVYNSMFSFTSMGATIDYKINSGSG
ncbi:hypothetical protein ABKV19_001034, partial [Rosa sericea]